MRWRLLGIVVAIVILVGGCGVPDVEQGNGMQPVVTSAIDLVAPGMERATTAAVAYLRQREAIVSGEPVVRYAQQVTPRSIRGLQLNIGNWDPACERPMSLVILEGEFDGRNLFITPGADAARKPGRYVGLVFDRVAGEPGDITFTILSADGGVFRTALHDESLPPSDMVAPAPVPPYVPCGDVSTPGQPEPSASPTR